MVSKISCNPKGSAKRYPLISVVWIISATALVHLAGIALCF
jgi:hypothetical protein